MTATFFQNLQKELKNNPELSAAFPKTLAFIGQIEPYLYASYLTTLRQAFFTDVNNFPFQLGAILRTPRIKKFMAQNPTANDVWLAVPVLEFIGDMHNGKSLPDAIKILYPDQELYAISPGYYNVLKLTVVLSESVRDVTGTKNWIDENTLETAYSDPVENPFFFAMLFESTKYLLKGTDGKSTYANNYITADNIIAVKALLTNFTSDYNDANELATAYAAIKKGSKAGTPITFAQVTSLLSATETDLKATFDNINKLAPLSEKFVGTTDAFFDAFSQLIVILGDFNNKNYSSGVMNSMLLINQYIQQQKVKITPFTKQTYFTKVSTNTPNVSIAVQVALDSLTNYYVRYPNDNINSLIKKLQTAKSKLSSPPTADQLIAINKLYDKIQLHNYTITASDTNHYDANNMIQKLLKYATLMASLADAKTSADVNAALDAAILPVGSSSIKYYTAFSFSLNSYIGGAYYHSTYNYFNTAPKPGESLKFNTLGGALPIGLNFSVSTRWPPIGAVSAFISVVDLGAIASYRLNNPPNSSNQTLPAFTFQNLLAPGGFIMLNRIGKTPLAFGLGIQRAPQLTSITNGSTDLTTDPKWRIGAFISVDIPLFDLYSSSLKRPITN